MIVYAIDPGPSHSGFVKAVFIRGRLERIEMADGKIDNARLLTIVRCGYGEFSNRSTIVACEWIANMGMPAGESLFSTARYVGRLQQAAVNSGLPEDRFILLKRNEIKLALCGSARAKDGNVRQAIIDEYPQGRKAAPGPTYGVSTHAWQALAVGIVAAGRMQPGNQQSIPPTAR